MNKNRTILLIIILIVITLTTFWKITSGEFLYADDCSHVYRNHFVTSDKFSDILEFWEKPYIGLYIPLTYTLWSLQAKVPNLIFADKIDKRPNPRIFHTVNLFIHIFNVLLVFFILRKISGNDLASCFGTLFFAVHPVQVETVVWISELKGLLGGFFSLSAILLYINYLSIKQGDVNYKNRFIYFLFAILTFLLALLSKPNSMVIPIIAGTIAILIFNRPLKQTIKEILPWLLAIIPIMIYTYNSQSDNVIDFIPSIGYRFLIAGDALSYYIYKLFLPVSLCIDYSRNPEYVLSHNWIWITGLIPYVVSIFIGCFLVKYHKKEFIAPFIIFVVALAPVLGFILFFFQTISGQADRYLYMAMLGPALGLTLILDKRTTIFIKVAVCGILVVLSILSFIQTGHWINNKALLEYTKSINPKSTIYYGMLSEQALEENNLMQAVAYCKESININKSSGYLIVLGDLLKMQGNYNEAISALTEAININPNQIYAYDNLGELYMLIENYQKAIKAINKALLLNPESIKANKILGIISFKTGKTNDAIKYFYKGIILDPEDISSYINLGFILYQTGNNDKAIIIFREALKIDPTNKTIKNLLEKVQPKLNSRP